MIVTSLTLITVYTHPLVILLWILASLTLDYLVNWIPEPGLPLSYVSPLIGFAIAAIPILAGAEYLHRPVFTRLLRETLGAPDLVAMERYYSLDPRSQIMVFEHKGQVSGVVAIDGARAGVQLGSVLGAEEGQLGEKEGVIEDIGLEKKGTRAREKVIQQQQQQPPPQDQREGLRKRTVRSGETPSARRHVDVVQLRHLDVDLPVRRAGVATELLVAALDHAFGISPRTPDAKSSETAADKVVALTNPLAPGGERLLTKFGFVPISESESAHWQPAQKVGLLRWKGRWLGVSKSAWEVKRERLFAIAKS